MSYKKRCIVSEVLIRDHIESEPNDSFEVYKLLAIRSNQCHESEATDSAEI